MTLGMSTAILKDRRQWEALNQMSIKGENKIVFQQVKSK